MPFFVELGHSAFVNISSGSPMLCEIESVWLSSVALLVEDSQTDLSIYLLHDAAHKATDIDTVWL